MAFLESERFTLRISQGSDKKFKKLLPNGPSLTINKVGDNY